MRQTVLSSVYVAVFEIVEGSRATAGGWLRSEWASLSLMRRNKRNILKAAQKFVDVKHFSRYRDHAIGEKLRLMSRRVYRVRSKLIYLIYPITASQLACITAKPPLHSCIELVVLILMTDAKVEEPCRDNNDTNSLRSCQCVQET